jgi:ADP-ribosyl-[dinitrogen reductase] hydrolase
VRELDSNRAEAVLLGVACGDALGRPVEFKTPREISKKHGRLTEMVGEGTWGMPSGTVTDDTDQMMCIARSLTENREFIPEDVAQRFVNWYDSGPFDIGRTTRTALSSLKGKEESWKEVGKSVYENLRTKPNAGAGNGSVMRCSPIAVSYNKDLESLFHASVASSWMTHADPRCIYGCALLNQTIARLLDDEEPTEALEESVDFCRRRAKKTPETKELFEATEKVESLDESVLSNSGYVVDTLQSSFYYSFTSESFEEAVIEAVNGGGDTDTVGAVTGALAGARFGKSEVPDRWTEEILYADEISELSRDLSEENYEEFLREISH